MFRKETYYHHHHDYDSLISDSHVYMSYILLLITKIHSASFWEVEQAENNVKNKTFQYQMFVVYSAVS